MKMLKNIFVVGAGNIIQKMIGIARPLLIAYYFGASNFVDCLYIALIPINIIKMVIGTSIGELLIVEYGKSHEKRQVFTALFLKGVILAAVSFVIIYASAPLFIRYAGWYFSPSKRLVAEHLLRLLSVLVVIYVVNNMLRALALAQFRSVAYTISQLLASSLLVLVLFLYPLFGESVLPASILVAELSAMLILVYFFSGEFDLAPMSRTLDLLKSKFYPFLSISLIIGFERINPIVDSFFASSVGAGSIAVLSYAQNIYMSLLDVTAGSVISVLFPKLSSLAADADGFKEFLMKVTKGIIFVFMPLTAICVAYSADMVRLLYQRGKFTSEDTLVTAGVFLCYAVGMVFFQLRLILARRFYVANNWKFVIYLTLSSIAANYILDYVFLRALSLQGLALATSVVEIAMCVVMFARIRNEYDWRSGVKYFFKNAAICLGLILLVKIIYANVTIFQNYIWILGVLSFLAAWFIACVVLRVVPNEIMDVIRSYKVNHR